MALLRSLLQKYILSGILVLIPIFLTGWVVVAMVRWADGILKLLPEAYRPENLLGYPIPGLGMVISFLLLVFAGAFVANVFGRQILAAWEGILGRIPLVRWFYFSSKHILEAVFSQGQESFRRVAVVEYPRKGIFSIGFVTGETRGQLDKAVPGRSYAVFLPTTPNPTSGFLIIVPEAELTPLDWTVEEAFRYIVSAGVLAPHEGHATEGAPTATSATPAAPGGAL